MAQMSVVIPVYNAADCLAELYRRLAGALAPLTEDFEIVLVEAGSRDESWRGIQALARADARVKGYRLSRNFGQHFAITAGLDVCDGDWVVVMDCDLQDRPEDIPRLYREAQQGYDVVLARRRLRKDRPLKRLFSLAFYRVFGYLTDQPYDGAVGNFRIISRAVAESTRQLRERARFFGGLVSWVGFSVSSILVENDPRFAGESSYDFRKLMRLALDMVLAHSDKPLRLTIRFGLSVALFAFAFGVYTFVRAIFYKIPVSGWASLMVSMYMLGGVIIGLIGMVGLYLSRVFDEAKKRPLYVLRDQTVPRTAAARAHALAGGGTV